MSPVVPSLPAAALPWRHAVLAVAVMAIWGSNFVVMKAGLAHLPPLFFAALRFLFVVAPVIFFVKRPAVRWRDLAAYGVLIGVGQFGILFFALDGYISPGLASLVIQTQVFFTIGLAMMLSGERLRPLQWVALALAAAGLVVIARHTDAQTSVTGLLLTLAAAASWACANIVTQRAGRVDMVAYVVWSALFAVPPLFALAFALEGPAAMWRGLQEADAATWGTVAWQSVGNSLFGYAAWGWLLARHPAALVSPMALLVPVFGLASSALWLGEDMPFWKLAATALVLGGLALNLAAPFLRRRAQS
ncbi:MAG: putative amino-acid metabolite efflux pump [Hyphomicrobiales bacterium]|nr:putative amino-acid metabolite efflux pump [Hyphomicrobiales bacterium]